MTPEKLFMPSVKKFSLSDLSDTDILFELIKNSPYQQRKLMIRNLLLDLAAQKKADDMAEKDYFSHTSPDGITANENVRSVGYKLPDYYAEKGNNCESLSIGGNRPEDNVAGWLGSPKHRPHVFGDPTFYIQQECIGIGKAVNKADGRNIYVFLSAVCSV